MRKFYGSNYSNSNMHHKINLKLDNSSKYIFSSYLPDLGLHFFNRHILKSVEVFSMNGKSRDILIKWIWSENNSSLSFKSLQFVFIFALNSQKVSTLLGIRELRRPKQDLNKGWSLFLWKIFFALNSSSSQIEIMKFILWYKSASET